MKYRVRWDNEHACGWLPDAFETEQDAEQAGDDWLASMEARDPQDAEAGYSFEVIEMDDDDARVTEEA